MNKNLHTQTPLFDAVKNHMERDVVPFHVPGHKHGHGLPELREFLGKPLFEMDLNAMEDIDDLCNPISSIKASQELIADAFGAEDGYMLINGTTSGIHAMMLSATRPNDKIILPRNAHKSTISGLIISGAIPVYVHAELHPELGISTTVKAQNVKEAFEREPHAVATFVINPSYYGFAPDLKSIVRTSHRYGAAVLVDEAHGCHMAFHDDFPLTGMEAGADMAACSTHKTCGSFTQSSVLLRRGNLIPHEVVKQTLNLQRSTSASYPLMVSIDVARKQLALNGQELLQEALDLVRYARQEINQIEGLYAFSNELKETNSEIYDFDETKLSIHLSRIGLTGFQVEAMLRKSYGIQVELADLGNVMCIITLGDTKENVDKLIDALKDIAQKQQVTNISKVIQRPDMPDLIVTPRDAFYSKKKKVLIEHSVGEISGESVMAYPPGIPLICPGERITQDIIDYIKILKAENSSLQGTADPFVNYIQVLGY